MDDELSIVLEDPSGIDIDDELSIVLEDPSEMDIDFSDKLSIIPIDGAPHNKLGNLDYEEAGHTGFMPGRGSLLSLIPKSKKNSQISLLALDEEDTPSKMGINDIKDRIIRQYGENDEIPDDLQEGQYIYLLKEEEIQNG